MTDHRTTLQPSRPQTASRDTAPAPLDETAAGASAAEQGPDGFRRLAGIAGVTAVAVGLITMPLMGSAPGLGASPEEVSGYFASNGDLHRATVVIGALLGIPIVLFFAGVHRALAAGPGRPATGWATVFLYGAIMMSATAGLREALYALGVRYAEADPDPGVLALLSDGANIAGATLGVWLAVTVGAVLVGAVRAQAPRWYAGLCAIVSLIAVVSIIDTVSVSTGSALAGAAFAGFIVWMLTSAVVMLRRPLLP